MDFDPVRKNYNWNYSNPNKEGYTNVLYGTVLAIQWVQKRAFSQNGPGAPEFWPEGKPKMNLRIVLACPQDDGSVDIKTFTFQPASKEAKAGKKPSIHMDLFKLTGETRMTDLIGKTIQIATQPGTYGAANPRPFTVALADGGPFQLPFDLPAEFKVEEVLCNEAVHGGQPIAPQPMQQPQPQQTAYQYMYPNGYAPQANAVPQTMQSQPVVQQQTMGAQPAVQPPMQPTAPQGMDPNVAAAMQQLGAQNVQPVAGPYDESIPF